MCPDYKRVHAFREFSSSVKCTQRQATTAMRKTSAERGGRNEPKSLSPLPRLSTSFQPGNRNSRGGSSSFECRDFLRGKGGKRT